MFLAENLIFCKGRFSRFAYSMKRSFRLLLKKPDFIYLTQVSRLILISCCWLLKKTLVITANLINLESAPAVIVLYQPMC